MSPLHALWQFATFKGSAYTHAALQMPFAFFEPDLQYLAAMASQKTTRSVSSVCASHTLYVVAPALQAPDGDGEGVGDEDPALSDSQLLKQFLYSSKSPVKVQEHPNEYRLDVVR